MFKPSILVSRLAVIFQQVKRLGISEELPEERVRQVVFVNTLNITLGLLILTIGPLFSILTKSPYIIVPAIIEFTLVCLTFHLNAVKKYDGAGLMTYMVQCLAVSYFGLLMRKYINLEALIVWLNAINFLVFYQKRERRYASVAAVGTLILLEIFHFIPLNVDPFNISFGAGIVLRESSLFGIIFLTFLISRPLVSQYDRNPGLNKTIYHNRLFIAALNHELRTPLNAIFANAIRIQEELTESRSSDKMEEAVNDQLTALRDIKGLINDILTLSESQLNNGLKVITFSMAERVADLNNLIRSLLKEKDQKLVANICDMPQAVQGFPNIIHSIMINMVGNANKYGNNNSEIILTIRNNGDGYFTLSVSSKGPNIPKATLSNLMKPFKADRTGKKESSGLGGAVIHMFVQQLGGTWGISSENNITTIFAKLPFIKGNTEDIPKVDDVKMIQLDNYRVYVAEDEAMSAYALKILLTRLNATVHCFSDGSELINAMEKKPADLIFLDYNMPNLNGPATLEILKKDQRWRDIPVIMASGERVSSNHGSSFQYNADAYINKPIDFNEFYSAILSIQKMIIDQTIAV
ncbi:ATP-binding response regulator [Chitinophaga sancti]|uniref:histidine kinase n=1 Tax=Chitinophaga sancti TaxID=1004 RepID=A0A1K1ST13_9BACT|nr:hybrid sensor histidine kinase/response regulator [Chitinophaga sancti]WQD65407.1 hybrid sensor histidine kinase/response regulator [Chitinophaga sancti]WQG88970.1 hybrid sensor histidine kinase/response regulator [Chitinophaga sancti]SFW87372.1 His Kinase A (phospho-acceptor) domain-containing protein [Chitinophaga sancti]